MIFAEFYHLSTGWNGTDFSGPKKPIPKCGSDSCFRLDGRKSRERQIQDARKRANDLNRLRSDIVGFKLCAGRTFTDSRTISDLISL